MFDRYSIMLNPFFKNTGPHSIEKLLNKIDIQNKKNFKKDKIYDVKDLSSASKSFGLADKARAIATLCFCPPDKSFGNFL